MSIPASPAGRLTTVLASASPARLSVLRAAGVDPVVRVSGIDERQVQDGLPGADPTEVVAALARAKAGAVLEKVRAEFPESVVLGCDSMLLLAGTLRGKPSGVADARRQWSEMAGGTGELLTGHAVTRISQGEVTATVVGTERTLIRFGRPDGREVEAYLATGEPLDVAGSLTIDGYGGWFVDGVDGDASSVIGISLPLTRNLLASLGVSVVDLWREPAAGPDGSMPPADPPVGSAESPPA